MVSITLVHGSFQANDMNYYNGRRKMAYDFRIKIYEHHQTLFLDLFCIVILSLKIQIDCAGWGPL